MPKVWVRAEVFDHGFLHTPSKWTAANVLELLASLRAYLNGHTIVTTSQWIEFIKHQNAQNYNNPVVTESEGLAYWTIFTVLKQSICGGDKESMDIRHLGILFLVQIFNPHRIKSDVKPESIWPQARELAVPQSHGPASSPTSLSSPRSAGSSPRSQVAASNRARDTHAILLFVSQNIGWLLRICKLSLEPEAAELSLSAAIKGGRPAGLVPGGMVTAEDVDKLQLLLSGGDSFSSAARSLADLYPALDFQRGPVSAMALKTLLENSLVWNDQEYPSLAGTYEKDRSRPGLIIGAARTTVFRDQSDVVGWDNLHIVNCTDVTVYAMAKLRVVQLVGCVDCTVILCGSDIVSVQNSERINLHCITKAVKLENAVDTSVFAYTRTRPVLTGDTRGTLLAPFNVLYSKLDALLETSDVKLTPEYADLWAYPLCCTLAVSALANKSSGRNSIDSGSGGLSSLLAPPSQSGKGRRSIDAPYSPRMSASGEGDDSGVSMSYHLINPLSFVPLLIPERCTSLASQFGRQGGGQGDITWPWHTASGRLRLCLPEVYGEALGRHLKELEQINEELTTLGQDDSRKIHSILLHKFREWLNERGRQRQLHDLMKQDMEAARVRAVAP